MSRLIGAVIRLRLAAAASLVVALLGCGGGLFVGFGDFGFDSDPPSVSLATASSARRGETVLLSAAAADDFGIDRVTFFRDESGGAMLLGADGDAPYEWDTQIPLDAVGTVHYFARATDIDGNVTQSATVTVTVVP